MECMTICDLVLVCFYDFRSQLLIPKGAYKGQKLTTLVNMNMPATINKIKAKLPEITLVKYKIPTKTANETLIILSRFPIFFFIYKRFYG